MKQLKILILISMLNITMYHFDYNWGDIFNPLKAQDYPFNNQRNQLLLTDSSGKNTIIASRGQQIKINDDERNFLSRL